jgi:hypothetical protein
MKASVFRKLAQHTIVDVGWVDICEDSTGDPRSSYVVLRHTIGRVWGVKRKDKMDLLTLTFTSDPDGPDQSGWICIPTALIREYEVIRLAVEPGVQGGQSG